MSKKISPTRGLVILAALFCCIAFRSGMPAEAWDAAGKWLVEGVGFAEKSVVRVSLELEGEANLFTVQRGDIWYMTSYDMDLNLTASRLDINAWNEHHEEILSDLIPLPKVEPSVSEPFELPAVTTKSGLTYKITFTSGTSGKVAIDGTTDMGSIGSMKVGSDSAIWKDGTSRPEIDTNKSSGCEAVPLGFAALLAMLPFLFRGFRVK